jgi:hypothetical protein
MTVVKVMEGSTLKGRIKIRDYTREGKSGLNLLILLMALPDLPSLV